MTKAEVKNTATDPVVEMAQRFPAVVERLDKLDSMAFGLKEGERERTRLELAHSTAYAELLAIEDHIMSIPCHTLEGAAVHIMLAIAKNDLCSSSTGVEDVFPKTDRALRFALRIVAAAAGLNMGSVGGDYYASQELYPLAGLDLIAAE